MQITAMITEDDLFSRAILCDLLADFYPDVHVLGMAETVKDSVEFLRKQPVDLLFLDMELPDGRGPDILASIQDHDMKVIVTTSYSKYAEEQGSHDILSSIFKPLTHENLDEAMRKFLQSKHSA